MSYRRCLSVMGILLVGSTLATAQSSKSKFSVTDIRAVHRDGQTFVTWKDVAEGEAGADFRYSLYSSKKPITEARFSKLTPAIRGLVNHSGKQYGYHFFPKQRFNPSLPMAVIEPGGKPLPPWSGLAVRTVEDDGRRYYAVVAFDLEGKRQSRIVAGASATKKAVVEKVAPIEPLKIGDSATRGNNAKRRRVTGKQGLPLSVYLHASSAQGSPGSDHGDYYLFWGRPEWGYRDGLPWQFTVDERKVGGAGGRLLSLQARETLAHPNGRKTKETYWFGYYCVPHWAEHQEPRAYNFTELRMLWLIDWVRKEYHVDPNRIYGGGQSMGGWGSTTFLLRHSDIFAAIFPKLPITQQRRLLWLDTWRKPPATAQMSDGKTSFIERMDMVKFVSEHHEDLPFYGWAIGRHDGYASFKEQIEMVKAMTEGHHGFCFAWNNGNHSEGAKPMRLVGKYYPSHLFALNISYPAFGNSSIDDDLGTGALKIQQVKGKDKGVLQDDNGDLEGGINLGFAWQKVVDKPGRWSVTIENSLCTEPMTVDVTPRRCQKFKPKPGDTLKWTTSTGKGRVKADAWGLVTVQTVEIEPGKKTVLTITK